MGAKHLNPAKAAELRIATWFLEAGWEVFSPIVDAHQTDFVVRLPGEEELLAIQVKSKQIDALNEEQLANEWRKGDAPFDYLVLIDGKRQKGVIFAKSLFQKCGRTIYVLKIDQEGYSRGPTRPVFEPYSYNLAEVNEWERGPAFCERFLQIHRPGEVALEVSGGMERAMAQKLSWAETFAEMVEEREDWSDWDPAAADGLDEPEKV